jgi:iron complex outermembrane receptor protein
VAALLVAASLFGRSPQAAAATNSAPDLAELSLEELTKIEVTSVSKKAEPLQNVPAAIYVITGEDIRRAGVTSIPDALRLAPGLQVARINAHDWAISSRGFNNLYANKLLVLIDGRSVYTPLFAGVFWDVQDLMLEDVERIEVIRGPGATLWGANAVNGVINITTRSSKATQGALVTAGYGTEEQGFGAIRYGGKLGDHGAYRLYAKYFNRDDSAAGGRGEASDAWESLRAGFRTDWEPSAQNLFTVQGDIYQNRMDQTYNLLTPAFPFARDDEQLVRAHGGNMLGRWVHTLSDESDLRIQAYYDRTSRETDFFTEDRDTFDVEGQYRFAILERNDMVVGAGYRHSDSYNLRSNFTLWFAPEERQTHIFNTFVQDEITLVDDTLFLTLGSKFEYNEYTQWEIQPSGRLLWTPAEQHAIWGSVSRAVRTPSRADNDLRVSSSVLPPSSPVNPAPFPGVVTLTGDDDVLSEVLMAYEIGYRVQPQEFLSFDLALFYNDYDRLIGFESGPVDASGFPVFLRYPLLFVNSMEGETYGGELAGNWEVTDWWLLRGTYSYIDMKLRRRDSGADVFGDQTEGSTPHHQVSLRSLMSLPHNLQFDVSARYVDTLSALGIDSYTAVDVRLGWRPFRSVDISLVGQSLLDHRHAEFGSSVVREQQTEVERAFYGKVTWTF